MSTLIIQKNKPQSGLGQIRRSIADVLALLDQLARNSPNLICATDCNYETPDHSYSLPSYIFIGPKGGEEPFRIGLFGGLHGDEPESILGLIRFIRWLEKTPELAQGYCLFLYPVCNPTGYEDATRHCRRGADLNREFWKGSSEPEVRWLEEQLQKHDFHGLIALHSDCDGAGMYGYASGQTLNQALLEPALDAAEAVIPRDRSPVIDGFPARNGILKKGFEGILRAPPRQRPRPFEIILETPQAAPQYAQETALALALQTILLEYRKFMAYAINL
jgi:protein MpaA